MSADHSHDTPGTPRVIEHDPAGLGLMVRAALPVVPGLNRLPGVRKSGSELPELVLTRHDGKQHLLVTDKEGNIVFNGPIDTEEQRNGLPPEIAEKLKKLESKPNVLRLKVGGRLGATTRDSND